MTEWRRGPNWLNSEKNLLLDLVTEHFVIVENRKLDLLTVKKKAAEWKKICDEYNSRTPYIHRTAKHLKGRWEIMKKAARKQASNIRMHTIETGGGTPNPMSNYLILSRTMSLISSIGTDLNVTLDSSNSVPVTDQHSHKSISSKSKNCVSSRRRPSFPASSSIEESKILNDTDLQNKKEILKQKKNKTLFFKGVEV